VISLVRLNCLIYGRVRSCGCRHGFRHPDHPRWKPGFRFSWASLGVRTGRLAVDKGPRNAKVYYLAEVATQW